MQVKAKNLTYYGGRLYAAGETITFSPEDAKYLKGLEGGPEGEDEAGDEKEEKPSRRSTRKKAADKNDKDDDNSEARSTR